MTIQLPMISEDLKEKAFQEAHILDLKNKIKIQNEKLEDIKNKIKHIFTLSDKYKSVFIWEKTSIDIDFLEDNKLILSIHISKFYNNKDFDIIYKNRNYLNNSEFLNEFYKSQKYIDKKDKLNELINQYQEIQQKWFYENHLYLLISQIKTFQYFIKEHKKLESLIKPFLTKQKITDDIELSNFFKEHGAFYTKENGDRMCKLSFLTYCINNTEIYFYTEDITMDISCFGKTSFLIKFNKVDIETMINFVNKKVKLFNNNILKNMEDFNIDIYKYFEHCESDYFLDLEQGVDGFVSYCKLKNNINTF